MFTKILITVCAVFVLLNANAQLVASAGNDTIVCAGSTLILNGSARGGTPPYQFYWDSIAGLSCYRCASPTVETNTGNGYGLTVIDATGDTAAAQVYVSINPLPVTNITVSDTVVCRGQQVYLQGSGLLPGCGATGICTEMNFSPSVGSGTTIQPDDNPTLYPTIMGNFKQSCRQQMLYTVSELMQSLGGPVLLNGIGFDLGIFNSNAYLENFTIRLGCTNADSLADWNNSLVTTLSPSTIQPSVGGWNDFMFGSNFYWDGFSNLVVEVCWNNPFTQGNQNNYAFCTTTPFSSYIYSDGANNQCDTVTIPSKSNLRPNAHFSYCTGFSPTYHYSWLPNSGANSVLSPSNQNTYANPVNSMTYYLSITDTSGCVGKDSVNIRVRPISVSANIKVTNAICADQPSGAVSAVISANDSVYYQLLDVNYNSTLHSGTTFNNDTLLFSGLVAGTYHLLLSDSLCTNIGDTIVVGAGLLIADTTFSNPNCPSLTNGLIHAVLISNGDSVSYKLLDFNSSAVLDSGIVADSGVINFPSLIAGTYPLVINDSSCTSLYDITLFAPLQPTYGGNSFIASCYGDSTASGCLNIISGTPPFNFTWSDPAISGDCPSNMPGGNYAVTVTDGNNCSTIISNVIVPQNPAIIVQIIDTFSAPGFETVTASVTGGTPPYFILWDDGHSDHFTDSVMHTYTTIGAFYVTVGDSINCRVTDTLVISFPSGIPQNSSACVKIFPNPAADQLFIESNQIAIDEIEILDITGKQVLHQYPNGSHQDMLDVSGLSDGVYLLNTKSAGMEYRNWFVKSH